MIRAMNRYAEVSIANFDSAEGFSVSGCRVAFDLTLSTTRKANHGTIELYNLSDDVLKQLQIDEHSKHQNLAISLAVGYYGLGSTENIVATELIKGLCTNYNTEMENADRVTTFSLIDGYVTAGNVYVTIDPETTGKKGTTMRAIVEDVIADELIWHFKKVPEIITTKLADGLLNNKLKRDWSFGGTVAGALNMIADTHNLNWYLHDGCLYWEAVDEFAYDELNTTAALITPATGLLSKVSRYQNRSTALRTKSGEMGVNFKCLIHPNIGIGKTVQVAEKIPEKDNDIRAYDYLVTKLKIKGDTHANDWIMEVTALNERF